MELFRLLMLLALCMFYTAYSGKMMLLKMRGIRGNLLGKGSKPKSAILKETLLNLSASMGAVIQFAVVLFARPAASPILQVAGLALAVSGVAFFCVSVVTMRNNWRAGFDETLKTSLVTGGIYGISRNPAFVGFDLLYIGCALAFPHAVNITAAVFSIVLFHAQIKSEEAYLAATFGADYLAYQAKVLRYLGKRAA